MEKGNIIKVSISYILKKIGKQNFKLDESIIIYYLNNIFLDRMK